ncbi:MAG: CRTAC1 family protein [Pirellulaceae bacterium]
MTPTTPQPYISRRERRNRRAFRRSVLVIGVLATIVVVAVIRLNMRQGHAEMKQTELALPTFRTAPVEELPHVSFTDMTQSAGITFVHEHGAAGEKLLPETMGSGCALFDYDNDGDVDILLVNSARWPWDTRPAPENPPTMALYRNDGEWKFTDVTEAAGLAVTLYGMGAAVGDFDNDNDVDLFVTTVGPNRLFRNDGGVFVDVTAQAGVAGADDQWSSSCAWIDFNNDGRLDLFVCNYIHWSREIDLSQDFSLDGTHRAYGPPLAFEGAFAYVYRNDGDGRFTDVSHEVGVQVANPATQVPMGKSLGVIPVDLDQDGWMDVVVANDTVQNFLFHNEQGATFQEIGALAGVAFDNMGQARGAMGIDAAPFRNDATVGIAVGNFANEMTALFVSMNQPLQFFDAAIATGLGPPTRLELTFGIFFFDYDLDGRLDLLSTNGHLEEEIHRVQESQTYEQSPHLFWNGGLERDCEFVSVPVEKCGTDLVRPLVGRGSAFADLDQDGDLDVLITTSGGEPRLLRNEQLLGNHWLRFRLHGTQCNRSAIGARVEVHAGDRVLSRDVMPTRGYLSQSELTVTFGLGLAMQIDKAVIHWPGGGTQTVENPEVDRLHVIEETDQ